MFSAEEKKQYSRHFILDEIGIKGQEKLKNSKVLVIGAGGLGCPILQYLTAAGVGTIGIIDGDVVDQSNLQRQILFTTDDIGKSKALCAANRLAKLNPFIIFNPIQQFLNKDNAIALFKEYDVIVDGSDNFQTRYLSNDAAVLTNKPLVFGAIFKFDGQVSVFNYKNGPTYRCLFPTPPAPNSIPNCSEVGVLGVLPGIIGSLQASEALKIICELEGVLTGKLLSMNALTLQQNILQFKKGNFEVTELVDYDSFCGIKKETNLEINADEMPKFLQGKNSLLVDVRKLLEREAENIGGEHIPLHQIQQKLAYFKDYDNILLYCQVGQRSLLAAKIILEKFPNKNIKSLEGGLKEWRRAY